MFLGGEMLSPFLMFLNENMQGYNFRISLWHRPMMGLLSWLQLSMVCRPKVKAIAPSAMFVHCYAHRLNLVLSQGAKCLPECRIFFASLSGFATFFSKSTKRTYFSGVCRLLKVPRNAPTRWNFTSRIVSTVANNYDGLLQTFDNIIADTTMDDDTLDCAKGFVRKLEDFELCSCCTHMNKSSLRLMWSLILSRERWMFFTARKELSLFLHLSKRRGQRGLSKLFMPKQQISHQTQEMSP